MGWTLDRHLHPRAMRPKTESLEGGGDYLAKAMQCNTGPLGEGPLLAQSSRTYANSIS